MDTQVVELIGRNRLGSELLRAGLEVAVPARDRGVDLIAYVDLSSSTKNFTARPIQMKAATERSFGVLRKYERLADLIIAYIWFVDNPEKTETYALTYREALAIATKMKWTKTASFKKGGYTTSNPSRELCRLLEPYRMSPRKWREKVTGSPD